MGTLKLEDQEKVHDHLLDRRAKWFEQRKVLEGSSVANATPGRRKSIKSWRFFSYSISLFNFFLKSIFLFNRGKKKLFALSGQAAGSHVSEYPRELQWTYNFTS